VLQCTGSWVVSDRAMRVFSATGLKRLSQRSSEKYTGWPEILGFPSGKKKFVLNGLKNGNAARILQQRQRTKTWNMTQQHTMPVELKNEVFGLSGKPETVDKLNVIILAKRNNLTDIQTNSYDNRAKWII